MNWQNGSGRVLSQYSTLQIMTGILKRSNELIGAKEERSCSAYQKSHKTGVRNSDFGDGVSH